MKCYKIEMLEKFHETNVGKVFWSKLSLAFIKTKILKKIPGGKREENMNSRHKEHEKDSCI